MGIDAAEHTSAYVMRETEAASEKRKANDFGRILSEWVLATKSAILVMHDVILQLAAAHHGSELLRLSHYA